MYKILIEVHYMTKPGMRDTFLAEAAPCAAKSRSEEGNIIYDYFLNPQDENDILLIEKWRDDEALSLHFASEHFAELGLIKEKYVDDVIFNKHYVELA